MNLYDAHQHFHFDQLTPHRAVIDADLRALGLKRAVVNGTNEEEWPVVAALAKAHDWISPSFGVHPWDCGNRTKDWLEKLRAALVTDEKKSAALPAVSVGWGGKLPIEDHRYSKAISNFAVPRSGS